MSKKIMDNETEPNLDLENIVNEYSGYVYKIIVNITAGNMQDEDIEEIISDTFFILWKNREKIDFSKQLSSYIAGIAKNLIKEKNRKLKINYDISDFENVFSDVITTEIQYENTEKINIIERTIEQMKQEDIDIFNFFYYENRKINEISKMLNLTEFNVKSRLHRIRKKLKKELFKGGYSDEKYRQ